MEITSPGGVDRPSRVYHQQTRRAPDAGAAETTSPADQVDISPEAKRKSMTAEFKELFLDKVNGLPDVRQERVDEIQAEIEAGTYETPEKMDIAIDRTMGEILGD